MTNYLAYHNLLQMIGDSPAAVTLDAKTKPPQQNLSAVAAESGKTGLLWRSTGGKVRAMNYDKKRREEKNEHLMHLICWGPN